MTNWQLPSWYDEARNEYYAGGYEGRFRYRFCQKCVNYACEGELEGCIYKGYPVPFLGPTRRRKCIDYIERR